MKVLSYAIADTRLLITDTFAKGNQGWIKKLSIDSHDLLITAPVGTTTDHLDAANGPVD
jgi:hypothetical protein